MCHCVVVIPAYDPDEKLISLLKDIKENTKYDVVIVNDGSSKKVSDIFFEAGRYGEVLPHIMNMGKGRAIKTALEYIEGSYKDNVSIVVADADGQHKVKDIIKVANKLEENKKSLILGCRHFTGDIPFRSKFGNIVTKYVFKMASGKMISDTQTGLRAFSKEMIPFLMKIEGNRYEYEMNVLLESVANKINIIEVPIETVYLEENKSSHFKPIKDSFIIYKNIIKFSFSSLASFFVDFILYSIMILISGSVLVSNITARIISASFNFYINKNYVFKHKESTALAALKYFALAACLLVINTLLLTFIVKYLIKNRLIAKIIVEMVLFIISYIVQRLFVFKSNNKINKTQFN